MWCIKIKKDSGFSLLEIIIVIALMAILASFAAPNFRKQLIGVQYQGEVQDLMATIIDARNHALTNKKCANGSQAAAWDFTLEKLVGSELKYQLHCEGIDGKSHDEVAWITLIETEIDSLEVAALSGSEESVHQIKLIFFAGAANSKLEYGSNNKVSENLKLVVKGQELPDKKMALCFNRVAGFPTLNKHSDTCLTH